MASAAELMAMSEDAFKAHATREAALAIGDWLMAGVKLNRPLRSLTLFELECMAGAAIARWTVERSRRAAAGHPDPTLFAI